MNTATVAQNIITLPSNQQHHIEAVIKKYSSYQHPFVEVQQSITVPGQKALRATQNIAPNTVIFTYTNTVSHLRTRTSIQVGEGTHIEAGEFGSYTNHSCNPNAAIKCDTKHPHSTVMLVTINDISAGQEITFDYATTEDNLTKDLQIVSCLCGQKNCRGKVKHFGMLNNEEKQLLIKQGLPLPYLIK